MTKCVEHTLFLRDSTPIKQRVRPVPYPVRDFVVAEIERLLKLGIISPADPGKCPYASPIVVVSKKDATWRLCVDFRRLNDLTIKDLYPLPRIEEIFTALHGATCFIALDLLMGYHQTRFEKKIRRKRHSLLILDYSYGTWCRLDWRMHRRRSNG